MNYKEIDFMTPIIDFIRTCPFLGTDAEISPMAFNPDMVFDGNALTYTGTPKPVMVKDINGNVTSTKQANFILYIRRFSRDKFSRLDIANFLQNFETWVEEQDIIGTVPRFGTGDYPERIWADNGMFWQATEQADVTDYMIQMHVDYRLIYNKIITNRNENALNGY